MQVVAMDANSLPVCTGRPACSSDCYSWPSRQLRNPSTVISVYGRSRAWQGCFAILGPFWGHFGAILGPFRGLIWLTSRQRSKEQPRIARITRMCHESFVEFVTAASSPKTSSTRLAGRSVHRGSGRL